MNLSNLIASFMLVFVIIFGGMSSAMAEDQTPAMPENPVLALLDTAAESCRVAIERESAVGQDSEGYIPRLTEEIPACIAHEAMQETYWQQQVALMGNLLATEVANSATSRDEAALDAARAANALAAETAAGEQASARSTNALAAVVAEGALTAEQAANRLEAEQAIDPVTPVVGVDAIGELEGLIDGLSSRIDDALAFQHGVCAANPGVSWCPR